MGQGGEGIHLLTSVTHQAHRESSIYFQAENKDFFREILQKFHQFQNLV